jgi:hypothetical protein
MDEELLEKARAFADARGAEIGEGLGFGIHGIVVVLKSEQEVASTALKIHRSEEPYWRERDAYERLKGEGITRVSGFHVPQLLGCDDKLLALEMTIVMPPFVLDFAGAFLDEPPEFSEEVWAEWREKNEEQFGADWPRAQAILAALADLGVHMLDPSPSNIRFRW